MDELNIHEWKNEVNGSYRIALNDYRSILSILDPDSLQAQLGQSQMMSISSPKHKKKVKRKSMKKANYLESEFPQLDRVLGLRNDRLKFLPSTPQTQHNIDEASRASLNVTEISRDIDNLIPLKQSESADFDNFQKSIAVIQRFLRKYVLEKRKKKFTRTFAATKIQAHVRRFLSQKRMAQHANLLGKARWTRKEHRVRVMKKCWFGWIDYVNSRRQWRRRMEHYLRLWGSDIHRFAGRPFNAHQARIIRSTEGTTVLADTYNRWRQKAVVFAKLQMYTAYNPWIERASNTEDGTSRPIRLVSRKYPIPTNE